MARACARRSSADCVLPLSFQGADGHESSTEGTVCRLLSPGRGRPGLPRKDRRPGGLTCGAVRRLPGLLGSSEYSSPRTQPSGQFLGRLRGESREGVQDRGQGQAEQGIVRRDKEFGLCEAAKAERRCGSEQSCGHTRLGAVAGAASVRHPVPQPPVQGTGLGGASSPAGAWWPLPESPCPRRPRALARASTVNRLAALGAGAAASLASASCSSELVSAASVLELFLTCPRVPPPVCKT